MSLPPIIVTQEDFQELCALFERTPASAEDAIDRLDAELARAELVSASQVPPDVVTMGSHVLFEELGSGVCRALTLVYPRDADAAEGRISVLSPVGSALLGLRTGQTIEWPIEGDRVRRYRIRAVLFQPQAAERHAVP